MNDVAPLQDIFRSWQRRSAVVAVVGCALGGFLAVSSLDQFLRSYLVAFLFWWSISIGCLGQLMMYHLVGGRWGAAGRPFFEAGSLTIPLTALLFLPIALHVDVLYPWTEPGVVSEQKAMYLNIDFFNIRAAVYFVIWTVLALVLRQPDSPWDAEAPRWRRLTSAGGLVALVLTVTFAGMDWGMSLDPHWFSTIYGAIIVIGGGLGGMAFVTLTCAILERRLRPDHSVTSSSSLADLATLTLAFLMLWAYFRFSQFLIIWSGNMPEENVWYVNRIHGGWQWVAQGLVVLEFFVPFFALLSRELKQSPRAMIAVAGLVIVTHFVEMIWTITPSFHPRQLILHWGDLVLPIAIGGLWMSVYVWRLVRRVPQLTGRSPA